MVWTTCRLPQVRSIHLPQPRAALAPTRALCGSFSPSPPRQDHPALPFPALLVGGMLLASARAHSQQLTVFIPQLSPFPLTLVSATGEIGSDVYLDSQPPSCFHLPLKCSFQHVKV